VPPLLELDHVTTGYGKVEVLHDVHLVVPHATVVALLGPNGVGKTTTLRAISGTLPCWRGAIRLDGRRIDGQPPHRIAAAGVTLVPEGRGIFPGLDVADNLRIAANAGPGPAAAREAELDRVLDRFPRLAERRSQRAGTLSGGEQQMLAVSRAFLAKPRLLLVDEISMGLAPQIVERLFDDIAELKRQRIAILLVEQYLTYALRLADICYVMARGRIAFVGEPSEVRDSAVLASTYLGTA
jgi:branched-chain amino acid transport system ATP-binding protein